MAEAVTVEPFGFRCGVLEGPALRPARPHSRPTNKRYPHVAYCYEGKRRVQGIRDPYPKGFPPELAIRQMNAAAWQIEYPAPGLERKTRETANAMEYMASLGLHAVTPQGMRRFINEARRQNLSDGTIYEAVETAALYDPATTRNLLNMGGFKVPAASRSQALQVIQAGRQADWTNDSWPPSPRLCSGKTSAG